MDFVIDAGTSFITSSCINITDIIKTLMLDEDESFTVEMTTTNSDVALGNNATTVINGVCPGLCLIVSRSQQK